MPVFHTRLTPDLVEHYTRTGHWGSHTFYAILHQQAAAHPDREAIIDHRQRVTYGSSARGSIARRRCSSISVSAPVMW